MVAKPRSFPK